MIVIAGTATIHAEHWDEAVQQAQQMSAATERNTFFIFEEWETAEALAQYFQAPHFQAFGAYLASALNGGMNIKRYDVSTVGPL